MLSAFVLCSGACSLVYQVVWQREFRLIFGASTSASGAVLAAFIGGLGAGSLALGGRAERSKNPLAFYGTVEALIAVSAALTPFLLEAIRVGYVAVGGTHTLGPVFGTALRIVLSALVVFVPTFLMGGTMPALARAITGPDDPRRSGVGLLYGVNTIGAVAGVAISTFVLLEAFGNRSTLWLGALVNLVVALLALRVSRGRDEPAVAADAAVVAPEGKIPRWVIAAAFAVGAAFFLMEMVWFRMLAPLLGGSVFTFGVVLCCALAGIGLGGTAAGRLWTPTRSTTAAFAATCLFEALAVAVPFALGDRIAYLALLLRPLADQGFAGSLAAWGVIGLVVVFPAAFIAGIQFPLLITLAGDGRPGVARQVGQVYAANTVGSMVGSLGGGFGLLPWLSAPTVWRLVIVLLIAVGAWAALRSARSGWPPLALLGLAALLCVAVEGPTAVWRQTPIGAGRVRPTVLDPAARDAWTRAVRRGIVWEKDGVEVAVALEGSDGLAFVVSGKSDGNALGDKATQVMSGLLGALLHPEAKTALVIGLGTGSTAGWLGQVPTLDRVDVMELEPAILEVARRMPEVNENVLENPKVHLMTGDARELLATSNQKYDIVFSEPSNPYRSGIANLYTQEYYQSVQEHLAPGGLFIQFLQSYEVEADVIHTVYGTLRTVFPTVETWYGGYGDLLLIGAAAPPAVTVAQMRQAIATEPYATALRVAWGTDQAEGVYAHRIAGPGLADRLITQLGPEPNTDDENRIEFGFARTVGGRLHQSTGLIAYAQQGGTSVPPDGLDLPLLKLEQWLNRSGVRARTDPWERPAPDLGPGETAKAAAMSAFARGDLPGIEKAWPADAQPRTGFERLVRLASRFRAPAAEREAERAALLPLYPVEVELIEAFARIPQGEAAALQSLDAAFTAHRTVPWTQSVGLVRTALTMVATPGRSTEWYRRMAVALGTPFAALSLEGARVEAHLRVVARARDVEGCAAAYEALGDDVIWTHEHLAVRLACFERQRPLLAGAAAADLARFTAGQAKVVGVGRR